jgi:tungstate transport system ATP-binding protein
VSAVLRLHDVEVCFGRGARAVQALRVLSLQVQPGERLALIGANGCGKSTLLRVMHGLLAPSAGQVWREPLARQALLFQKPFFLHASVQSNVALGLWLRGQRWAAARSQAQAALHTLGLQALAARNARTLSGGQQQRVAMARALAGQPQVLLLDEPTASLDPHAKREVEALMHAFAQATALSQPPTLIFASHNLGQVKRLASRVVYLEQGRVLADLPVNDFFNGPLLQQQHPAAHMFVKGEMV